MVEPELDLRSFFDNSGALMFEATLTGELSAVNEAWRSVLGYTKADVRQLTLNDTIHPASRPYFSILFYRLLAGRAIVADLTLQSKASTSVDVTGTLTCVFDGNEPNTIQGIFHDVRSVRQSEHQLKRFFDLSMDLLCTASVDGHFKLLNPAFERTLGFTREELLAQSFMEFVHPDDQEATLEQLASLAAGKPALFFENRFRCRDGSYRTLSWTSTPGDNQIYAVARDVTDAKEAERELRGAKDEAEAANRAKSRFLATMSHELRTPLNSVIGFTNVLLKNKNEHLSAKELEYLSRIGSNGRHLLVLINDILDLSKIEAGKLEVVVEPVCLDSLVAEVLAQIEGNEAVARLTLRRVVPDGLGMLMADRDKMKQVLLNLVGNALKFTHRGSVTVEVTADRQEPVQIAVIDTGVGIAPDRLGAIFDPFEQAEDSTTRRFGGTGLGLTISRFLCSAMGFRLSATSQVGRGSTFVIDLTGDAGVRSTDVPPAARHSHSEPVPVPSEVAS